MHFTLELVRFWGRIQLSLTLLRLGSLPPGSLNFIASNVISRWQIYRVSLYTGVINPPIYNLHRLQLWNKRVSNPCLSPCFRLSASGLGQPTAFAFGVPKIINAFHCSDFNSIDLPNSQDIV